MSKPNPIEIQNTLNQLKNKLEDLRTRGLELQKQGVPQNDPELQYVARQFSITRGRIKDNERLLELSLKLESIQKNDPIDVAKQKTQVNARLKNATDTKNQLESIGKQGTTEWNQASALQQSAQNKLNELSDSKSALNALKNASPINELPIQPDPELLKKEALARAQTIRAEAEQFLQQKKEEELNKVRDKVELVGGLLGKAVGLYLKLPIIDPKFLAYIAYMEAKEKLRELKQKASKENLKKSKEAFTFPMKPPLKLDLGEVPIPTPPKIPELPRIDLPNL